MINISLEEAKNDRAGEIGANIVKKFGGSGYNYASKDAARLNSTIKCMYEGDKPTWKCSSCLGYFHDEWECPTPKNLNYLLGTSGLTNDEKRHAKMKYGAARKKLWVEDMDNNDQDPAIVAKRTRYKAFNEFKASSKSKSKWFKKR